MKNRQSRGFHPNFCLSAGLLLNLLCLLVRAVLPERILTGPSFFLPELLQGLALALILFGLLLSHPRRAERLRAWKRRRLSALFH